MSEFRAFDFETHLITPNNLAPKPVCWSWSDGLCADTGVKLADNVDVLLDWLEDDNVTLMAHNMPFDAMLLVKHYGVPVSLIQREIDLGRLRDTRIREALINVATGGMTRGFDPRTGKPVKRFSLADCVNTYLNKDISDAKTDPDAWRLRYSELDGVPLEEWPQSATDYALMDSVYCMKVFASQCGTPWQTPFGRLQEDGDVFTIRNELAQTRASWDMHCMATRGPFIDEEERDRFGSFHLRQKEEGTQQLKDLDVIYWKKQRGNTKKGTDEWDWSTDLTKLKQMIADDFTEQGVEVPRNKPTDKALQKHAALHAQWEDSGGHLDDEPPKPEGTIKYGQDVLLACRHPALLAYGECQQSAKLVSTYLPPITRAGAGRMCSNPNALVSTGRTSWGNPNMQNPPRKGGFRECFVPSDGLVFASIDYSGIELVSLAQVLWERHGAPEMMKAINAGKDLHVLFGANIIGKTYEECMVIRKDKSHPDFKLVTTARQLAKVFNFGSGGGQGARTFFMQMDPYTKQAMQAMEPGRPILDIIADLIRLWKETWNCWSYFRWTSNQVKQAEQEGNPGFVYQHPISGRIRGHVGYTDGCNLPFQGRSADGAKNAMRLLSNWLFDEDNDYGVSCWAFVHDEFLFEGPTDTVTDWCTKASELMVQGMQPFVPDVKVEAEPAAMFRWLKEAEPFWLPDGTLDPWDRVLLPADITDRDSISNECIAQPYYADVDFIDVRGPRTELEKIGNV